MNDLKFIYLFFFFFFRETNNQRKGKDVPTNVYISQTT